MIESYTQKVIFIDENFLNELKQNSLSDYESFESPVFDTKIIKLPSTAEEANELMRHMHPSEIKVGSILVKPGYTDQFIPIDSVADDCAVSKYQRWVELCIALGAKKVSISNIEDVSLELDNKMHTSVSLAGTGVVAEGQAGLALDRTQKTNDVRKYIMQFNAEATGGAPDLAQAERILNQYNLQKDGMFRSIVEMRKVQNNQLKKHEFSLDLSKDVKRILDSSIKAKAKLMSKIYAGQAEFDKANETLEKQRTALKISVVVEF